MGVKVALDLPEDESNVRMARRMGRLLLEEQAVPERVIDDIELVLGELCTNVIRHARSHAGQFQVALEYLSDRVVITVADRGQGFSTNDVPAPGSVRSDGCGRNRIGGFGLPIVERLSDKLDFRSADPQGTVVRVEKRLDDRDGSRPPGHDGAAP